MSVAIIHLTDIHMVSNASQNIILSRKQQLVDACYSALSNNDSVIIVISGDIAYSGKSEEYENAFELIYYLQDGLGKYLNCAPDVFMVPGNHDCNFDESHSLRNRLLSTIEVSDDIDLDIINCISKIQKNFYNFSAIFNKYDSSSLCNIYEMSCGKKKILFQMLNTAWMSQKDEQPGKLIYPCTAFKNFNAEDYDCIFTVMHHPYNWLHPDNCLDFLQIVRKTTDVLLIGHEHTKDSFTCLGEKWNVSEYHGRELQNYSNIDSAFSIYKFDDSFENVTTIDFSWERSLFCRISEKREAFKRNTLISSLILTPSRKFVNEFIEDPGMIITHENADNVRLPEFFCWPELEKLDMKDSETFLNNKKITYDIPLQLIKNDITVIIGDSLSGKTSLVKMLFREYSQREECCVLLQGEDLNTVVERNLKEHIFEVFINEYSNDNLEVYRQLKPEQRILLIDNFNNIPYHDERRSVVLSYLCQFASKVVILTDSDIEARLVCSKVIRSSAFKMNYYKICNFGNSKRYELIKKWYCLRDEYANGDNEVEKRISNSNNRINTLLGSSNGFIPATPIYLINLLQNIDSIVPATFSGSQYGFLYDSLINKSFSVIHYTNPGDFNIYINIMSNLAFIMLKMKSSTFSKTELYNTTDIFSKSKKVSVNPDTLISNMLTSKIIQEVGPNTYKFRYPYVFYYFSGRYIAYNLKDFDVKEQIDYMISRLNNEKYGNIIIFTCHFSNSIDIIENILLISYSSLEKYEMFDFDKHTDIFDRAKTIMDNILTKSNVGTDNDVERNYQSEFKIKDKIGIQDGSVYEPIDESNEYEQGEREKDIASLSAAMRTLDVLGQIIMNYPGDISGDVKISIIDELHNLGMRITEAMISTIILLEKDFLEYVVNFVKDKKQLSDHKEIIEASQTIFSFLVAQMSCGMIRKISKSLCSEASFIAVQETFTLSSSISKKLILADLQFNLLKKPNIHEVLMLADEFEKSKTTQFAGCALRLIVSDYLKFNKCGSSLRAQLCSRFNLPDKTILLECAKSYSQK